MRDWGTRWGVVECEGMVTWGYRGGVGDCGGGFVMVGGGIGLGRFFVGEFIFR